MSENNESHTIKSWLKIAGLISESSKQLITEEEDEETEETNEEPEEELDLESEANADEEEEEAEEAEDEEAEEEAEEKPEKPEAPVPTDVVTLDAELGTFLADFEKDSLTQVESLSLSKALLEQEVRFDVVKFTDNVARLIDNFTNLVDYEKIIIDKAESFLTNNHDEEVAQIFIDMLADRHDISLDAEGSDPEIYAAGATGAGE